MQPDAAGIRHNPPPMEFIIDIQERDGLRTMCFESKCVQGAMRIAQPWDLVLEYTQVMMAALLLRDAESIRRILLIGLGTGSLTKFLYRHCPQAHLTVVEISPRVVAAAREHFELPDDPTRLNIVVGDGVNFVQHAGTPYDLILVDGFNEFAHPGDLNTQPFYQNCRLRLSDQGFLVVNLIGLSHNYKGGFAYIESAFDGRAVRFPKCKSGNTIAFAATGEKLQLSVDELKVRAMELEVRTGLSLMPMLIKLEAEPVCSAGTLTI